MDVAISALRSELATWVERARRGEDVIVTDRGLPVARLTSLDSSPLIEQLTRAGVLSAPRDAARPVAATTDRVPSRGSVSDLVGEQRG